MEQVPLLEDLDSPNMPESARMPMAMLVQRRYSIGSRRNTVQHLRLLCNSGRNPANLNDSILLARPHLYTVYTKKEIAEAQACDSCSLSVPKCP